MKRQAKQKLRQPIFAETFSFFLQNLPRGEKQVKWGVLEKKKIFVFVVLGLDKGGGRGLWRQVTTGAVLKRDIRGPSSFFPNKLSSHGRKKTLKHFGWSKA